MIDKIKSWFFNTAIPFLKTGNAWLHIGSGIASLMWFGQTENPLAALWILVLAAFWGSKLFGIDIVLFGKKKKEVSGGATAPTNPMGSTGGGTGDAESDGPEIIEK